MQLPLGIPGLETTQPPTPETPPRAPLIERNIFAAIQTVPSRRIPAYTDEEIANMWWNQ